MDSSSAMAWATGKVPIAKRSQFSSPPRLSLSPRWPKWKPRLTNFNSIFVHARDTTDRQALIPGSKVSFIFEADAKGGKAKEVSVEEMAEAVVLTEGPREMGTVKVSVIISPYLVLRFMRMRDVHCCDGIDEEQTLTSLAPTALEYGQSLRIHWAGERRGGVSRPMMLFPDLLSPQSLPRLIWS